MRVYAFVTGGSRGIGRSIVLRFAREGYNVAFSYNNREDLAKEVLKEVLSYGVESFYVKMNVADPIEIREAYETVSKRFPYLNILVNNAGILSTSGFEELSLDEWKRVIDVNLTGVFLVTKIFLPLLKKAEWGSIINIASISGQTGHVRGSVAYVASKAGVIGLTRKLAVELAPKIRVNAVAPSFVETDMVTDLLSNPEERRRIIEIHPLREIAKPEDIAEAVLFLASPRSRFITGHTLSINGGRLTI
ncbi:MAG: SDR family NAD(P)-dependent oxidoreductase [Sulfolobales archaeon]